MELNPDLLLKIAYALGIGVLIGLERSILLPEDGGDKPRDCEKTEPSDTMLGVRTFSILSLGGLGAAMVGEAFPLAAAAVVLGLMGIVLLMYWRSADQDPGITTEISAVAACGLGLLCHSQPHSAGVMALIITALLASKRFMSRTLRELRRVELTDTIKFLAVIIIALPLLPNQAIGPYEVFNPYKVLFLVILISGISFVGYFLTKFLGAEQGLSLTGLFGGLTSSTAVTAAMASQAKSTPRLLNPCLLAAVIANATMFGRVLVVVTILDRALATRLVGSIGAMMVAAAVAAGLLWLRAKKEGPEKEGDSSDLSLKNPFSFWPAIKFAGFFVLILFGAKMAKISLGDEGLYLAALASGLADVDAITLSIAEQTKALNLAAPTGAIAITIAVVANSVVKSGIGVYSGGWRFGSRLGAVLLGATGAGLVVLLALNYLAAASS